MFTKLLKAMPALLTPSLAVAVVAGGLALTPDTTKVADAPAHTIELTAAQADELAELMSTDEGAAQLIDDLQVAFEGVATVSTTPPPSAIVTEEAPALADVAEATVETDSDPPATVDITDAEPAYAVGWDRDHAYVIVSYADAASGLIAQAVQACTRIPRVPAWLCVGLGALFTAMVRGWSPARDHGVFAELWPWPARVRSGRY